MTAEKTPWMCPCLMGTTDLTYVIKLVAITDWCRMFKFEIQFEHKPVSGKLAEKKEFAKNALHYAVSLTTLFDPCCLISFTLCS